MKKNYRLIVLGILSLDIIHTVVSLVVFFLTKSSAVDSSFRFTFVSTGFSVIVVEALSIYLIWKQNRLGWYLAGIGAILEGIGLVFGFSLSAVYLLTLCFFIMFVYSLVKSWQQA